MTGPNLSPYWDRWRRKRRGKYLRAGATPSQAEAGSSLEAEARQRIEKTAGRRVALAAQFGLIPGRNGGETLGFWIDPALIDPTDRDAHSGHAPKRDKIGQISQNAGNLHAPGLRAPPDRATPPPEGPERPWTPCHRGEHTVSRRRVLQHPHRLTISLVPAKISKSFFWP